MTIETAIVVLALLALGLIFVIVGLAGMGHLNDDNMTKVIVAVAVMALFAMMLDSKKAYGQFLALPDWSTLKAVFDQCPKAPPAHRDILLFVVISQADGGVIHARCDRFLQRVTVS